MRQVAGDATSATERPASPVGRRETLAARDLHAGEREPGSGRDRRVVRMTAVAFEQNARRCGRGWPPTRSAPEGCAWKPALPGRRARRRRRAGAMGADGLEGRASAADRRGGRLRDPGRRSRCAAARVRPVRRRGGRHAGAGRADSAPGHRRPVPLCPQPDVHRGGADHHRAGDGAGPAGLAAVRRRLRRRRRQLRVLLRAADADESVRRRVRGLSRRRPGVAAPPTTLAAGPPDEPIGRRDSLTQRRAEASRSTTTFSHPPRMSGPSAQAALTIWGRAPLLRGRRPAAGIPVHSGGRTHVVHRRDSRRVQAVRDVQRTLVQVRLLVVLPLRRSCHHRRGHRRRSAPHRRRHLPARAAGPLPAEPRSHRADIAALSLEDVEGVVGTKRFAELVKGAGEGGLAGFYGPAGAVVDVPALLALALRSVNVFAYSYGFDPTTDEGRAYALSVIDASAALGTRAKQVTRAGAGFGQRMAGKEITQRLLEHLPARLMVRLAAMSSSKAVPVAGAATGAAFNAWFLQSVAVHARMAYRQKFLERRHGPEVLEAHDL